MVFALKRVGDCGPPHDLLPSLRCDFAALPQIDLTGRQDWDLLDPSDHFWNPEIRHPGIL